MKDLENLCKELNINTNILENLNMKEKKELYDILKDPKIIEKTKEMGITEDAFTNRLLGDNPMILWVIPLHIGKEKIINQLERIAWA